MKKKTVESSFKRGSIVSSRAVIFSFGYNDKGRTGKLVTSATW